MNAVHPVEQLATCNDGHSPLAFVRKARELLIDNEDIALATRHDGLLILGHAELDLVEPRRVLRQAFGDSVQFAAPAARLLYRGGWQQPIMGFRVRADRADTRQIQSGLESRAAKIFDVEERGHSSVIRGQAPLARLIGYPGALQRLTDGSAHAIFWLSHYEPLWSYSSETMACYEG